MVGVESLRGGSDWRRLELEKGELEGVAGAKDATRFPTVVAE